MRERFILPRRMTGKVIIFRNDLIEEDRNPENLTTNVSIILENSSSKDRYVFPWNFVYIRANFEAICTSFILDTSQSLFQLIEVNFRRNLLVKLVPRDLNYRAYLS